MTMSQMELAVREHAGLEANTIAHRHRRLKVTPLAQVKPEVRFRVIGGERGGGVDTAGERRATRTRRTGALHGYGRAGAGRLDDGAKTKAVALLQVVLNVWYPGFSMHQFQKNSSAP